MADMAAAGSPPVAERVSAQRATGAGWVSRVATRLELRRVLGYDALALLALSGLAVTQPLLDLFGKNPEFFVAAEATRTQIVAFGLVVTFGVALVGIVLELAATAVGHRVGAVMHALLVGALGTALGATVARQLDLGTTLGVVGLSLAIGGAVLWAEQRTAAMRLGLRYLSLAPLLFLGLFLLTSGSSRLLWEDEAEAATGVAVEDPRPIVMIVFDELPVSSLMTAEGDIDASRFPNFARLAEQSTWFRNASALSPNTPGSLPTIQSGLNPTSGALPTSIDHPRNLFTLLGGSYQMDVSETITQLCPTTVCARAEADDDDFLGGLARALKDASVVYGHATLPPGLREDLPGVDQSWGGFLDDAPSVISDQPEPADPPPATTTTRPGIDDFMAARNVQMAAGDIHGTGELMRRMGERIGPEDQSRLYFVHDGLFPHFNWLTTPDGSTYPGQGGPPGSRDGEWGGNEFLIRQAQQRHLLQVGYADTLVGQLIDRLEAQAVWDDAVVVITADHGISFTADQPKRTPTDVTADEVYRVPMFIRVPGEREGEVSDENALNTDLLPTLVDVLGIDTDWRFDGRSLFGEDPPPTDKPVFYATGPDTLSVSIDGLLEVVARNDERFPRPGWRGVAAVGDLGRFVGDPVSALDADPVPRSVDGEARWELDRPDRFEGLAETGRRIPLVLDGRLTLERGHEPHREALVAVNGRVAGVAGNFRQEDGAWTFSALLDFQQFRAGDNEVELLIVGGGEADDPTFYSVPRG